MAVADITEAINDVVRRIDANDTRNDFDNWLEIFGASNPTSGPPFFPFDRSIPDQRTVSDWEVVSRNVRSSLPATPFDAQEFQTVVDVVFRTCEAVRAAQIAGRISSDQEDAVVDQYNIAFP